jgi:CheY-like chemotaxis protein
MSKTIMIVDDSITIRQTLALTLRSAGYDIENAVSTLVA